MMGSTIEVNASNWGKEVLKSDILTVVDFWHNRCSWCLRLNPIFSEVAEEYKGKNQVRQDECIRDSSQSRDCNSSRNYEYTHFDVLL